MLQIRVSIKFIALKTNEKDFGNRLVDDLKSNLYIFQKVILKHRLKFLFFLLDLFCQNFQDQKLFQKKIFQNLTLKFISEDLIIKEIGRAHV